MKILSMDFAVREAVKIKIFRRNGQCPFLGEGGVHRNLLSLSQNECFAGLQLPMTNEIDVNLLAITFGTIWHKKNDTNFSTPIS